jgi:hypothetical protein
VGIAWDVGEKPLPANTLRLNPKLVAVLVLLIDSAGSSLVRPAKESDGSEEFVSSNDFLTLIS